MGKKNRKRYLPLSVDHYMPGQVCPVCSYKMDTVTGVSDANPPHPGVFSCCLQCGEIAQFDKDMKLQRPKPEDLLKMLLSKEGKIIMAGQDFIRRERAAGRWIGQVDKPVL